MRSFLNSSIVKGRKRIQNESDSDTSMIIKMSIFGFKLNLLDYFERVKKWLYDFNVLFGIKTLLWNTPKNLPNDSIFLKYKSFVYSHISLFTASFPTKEVHRLTIQSYLGLVFPGKIFLDNIFYRIKFRRTNSNSSYIPSSLRFSCAEAKSGWIIFII